MTDVDIAFAEPERRQDLALRPQLVRIELGFDREAPEPVATPVRSTP